MSAGFQTLARSGRTGYAVTDLPRDLLIRLVECPELPLRMGPAETIKVDTSVLVLRATLPFGGQIGSIAYKRVCRPNWLKQATQSLGPNRTLRVFRTGHRLLTLGIATARPLAVIVPSRFNPSAPSWLATEWLEDSANLAAFAERCRRLPHAERSRRAAAVAVAVGSLLGRMHAAGIAHRDLKPHNIMVRFDLTTGQASAALVDLDGVRFGRAVREERCWKNLSRLTIGEEGWRDLEQSHRWRFLRSYLTAAGLSVEPKVAWRRLTDVTQARQARRAA